MGKSSHFLYKGTPREVGEVAAKTEFNEWGKRTEISRNTIVNERKG